MSLEDLLNVDVSVASKVESSTADAPSSVTVFTQDEIRQMGIRNLQELFNFVPGFQSLRDVEQGDSEGIAARGRNTALGESVLVLVDGQRLNDLYTGGVSLLNREIAIENIKQVEIIRGPGSALYGANAFLGVVDIKTVSGVNALWAAAGNIGSRVAAASATQTVEGVTIDAFVRIAEQTGFTYNGVNDFLGNTGTQRDRRQALDATAKLVYKDVTVHVRHMSRQRQGFLTFASLQDPEGNHESMQQSSLSATYAHKFCAVDVAATGSYSQDQWRALSLEFPAGTELQPGFVLDEEFRGGPYLRTQVLNASVDAQWKATSKITVSAGVMAERAKFNHISSLFNHDPITLDYLGKVVEFSTNAFNIKEPRNELGAYVQGTFNIGDMTATAGVRSDFYSDFGATVNPRAAIVYKTPIDSRVKLMYGRAFRAPNYLESHDRFNPVDFGNSDLSPETVDTGELAYVQDIEKRFRGTATLFVNRTKDQITFGDPPPMVPENPLGAPTFSNTAESSVTQGGELEVRARVISGLDVYGTFTHMSGDLFRFPRNFGALAINFNSGPINLNVNGIARGKIHSLPDQDPYTVINARAEYLLKSHIGFFVNARNVLNTAYQTPSSLIPQGVPNEHFLVLVGVRASS